MVADKTPDVQTQAPLIVNPGPRQTFDGPRLDASAINHALAMRPVRIGKVDTSQGSREATFAYVLGWDGDKITDYGVTPVWWDVVRSQLREVPTGGWLMGTLRRPGRAYFLEDVDDEESAGVLTEAVGSLDVTF